MTSHKHGPFPVSFSPRAVTDCMRRASTTPLTSSQSPRPGAESKGIQEQRGKHWLIWVRGGRPSVHGGLIRCSAGKPSNRQTIKPSNRLIRHRLRAPSASIRPVSPFDRSDRALVRDVRWWNRTDRMITSPTLRLRRPRVPAYSPGVANRAGCDVLKSPTFIFIC